MNKKSKHILEKILSFSFILLVIFIATFTWYNVAQYKELPIFWASFTTSFNDYNVDTFNCQHFSMELQSKLKDDYNVLFVGGYVIDENYYVVKTSEDNISQLGYFQVPQGENAHEWIYIVDYNIYIETIKGTVIPQNNIFFIDKGYGG